MTCWRGLICALILASPASAAVSPPEYVIEWYASQNADLSAVPDAGHSKIWGSQYQSGATFPMVKLNLLNLTPVTGTLTVYAKLNTPQTTAVPGNYQDSYTTATALVTLNPGLVLPPTTCGDTVAASYPSPSRPTSQNSVRSATPITLPLTRLKPLTATSRQAVHSGSPAPITLPIPLDCSLPMGIHQVMVY